MIGWWIFLGALSVSGIATFIGWRKSPKAKDPYKRAAAQLIDYGEQCGRELLTYRQDCEDAIAYIEKLLQNQ